MSSIEVVVTITIDGIKVNDPKVKKDILDARSKMCDLVNNGWIDKYNALTEEISVDSVDIWGYQEAYITLTNACWTKILNKKYPNLRIDDENFIPVGNYYDMQIKLITV